MEIIDSTGIKYIMEQEIQKNVPMRYVLNLHRTRPDWPTQMDVLWEVYKLASTKNRSMEFLHEDLDALFVGVETKAKFYIDEFYKEGVFKKSRTSGERIHYKIDATKNPFL